MVPEQAETPQHSRAFPRRTVEHFPSLDLRELYRDGLQARAWSSGCGSGVVRVDLIDQGTARISYSIGYPAFEDVALDRTDCNYGGSRPWWLCPQCERRCAILYLPRLSLPRVNSDTLSIAMLAEMERYGAEATPAPDDCETRGLVECRECAGLTYTTSQSSRWIRHTRKSSRIRHRLGCEIGEPLRKPAGMHWRTFERLLAEYRAANAAAWEGLAPLLERRRAERTQELEALGLGAQTITP